MLPRLPSLRVRAPVVRDASVSGWEIFVDLIFVFAITRLADLVAGSGGPVGYLHAAVIAVLTWALYDAFAWVVDGAVVVGWPARTAVLLGILTFLIMGIAAPGAFGATRWTFAAAYLLAVLTCAWTAVRRRDERPALLRLPYLLGTAVMITVAAAVPAPLRWWPWLLAVLVLVIGVIAAGRGPGEVVADHLAERHHLVIMIALAAVVLAVARDATAAITDPVVLVAVVCAVGLVATLWWLYFGNDESVGTQAEAEQRSLPGRRAVLITHTLTHLIRAIGLVLLLAGLRSLVARPLSPLATGQAIQLAVGVALFCLGEAAYERRLQLGSGIALAATAVVVLPTIVPGVEVSGLSELALLLGVLLVHIGLRRVARNPGGVAG